MTREELLLLAKPILFNTEMVRAILDGKKTVTRRVVKRKYSNTDLEMFTNKCGTNLIERQNDAPEPEEYIDENGVTHTKHSLVACRYCEAPYRRGNYLYVRETWQAVGNIYKFPTAYIYKASPELCPQKCPYSDGDQWGNYGQTWRPSIHMPKEAARLFLRVKDVRAERLQDITEQQAMAEGCEFEYNPGWEFMNLWNSTIKKAELFLYGWDANPWVWVIEFERVVPE